MLSAKELLKTLVSHDSTYKKEATIADFLDGFLSGLGFDVQRVELENGRFNVYASRGDQDTDLLWYGHIDTVPVYAGWETDPFLLTTSSDGSKFYGLGSCDMKGGIAALLSAVTKVDTRVPVRMLFCADEEYDSEGAWKVVRQHSDMLKGVRKIISMEPGASDGKTGGANILTLGRRGRARLVVEVHGVSAHGAHPKRGVNAIDIANTLITKYNAMTLVSHSQLGESSHFVASVNSDTNGLSLPEYAVLEIDRHIVMPDTVQSVLSDYQRVTEECLAEITSDLPSELAQHVRATVKLKERTNDYMEPFVTEESSELARLLEDVIKMHCKTVVKNYGRSVGDENVFATLGQIDIAIIGPEGGSIHAPNEWVSAESLEECEAIYADVLRLVGSKY